MTTYAELQITSNFSFLRGGSHPEELVLRAHELGLEALALTDRNTLAGVVRAHGAAKEVGIRFVVGARLDLESERSLLCFPTDRAAYGRLSQLISQGQRRAEKGGCKLGLDDLLAHAEGQIVVALAPLKLNDGFAAFLEKLRHSLRGCYLAAQHLYRGDDAARIEALAEFAATCRTPLVATGDVLYHGPLRRPLQDVLTCIREHCTIDQAGFRLEANAERHLKPPAEVARLFGRCPEALARTLEIVEACRFTLDELAYDYPIDPPPAGLTVQEHLAGLTWQGAAERYPEGPPAKVQALLEHELRLIEELGYAPYFLTVHDIVRFARSQGILCQGRGSAANSAVCYCLGITAVDPLRFDLLFERFVSAERREPPDIDVDFEHERREEVIQYVYAKYGREHAGIAATVIHYRARSAIREVGKALGLSEDAVGALASGIWGWSEGGLDERLARERGLDPSAPRLRLALQLASELTGFPRHLSQHVGGFVLTRSRLDQVVPVVNAAMAERTMVEWDKDDLDALGILKIDVLALGMLTCIRKAFDLLRHHYGKKLDLATIPPEDPAVYEMLSRADSIGVFQVESRAQMTMLPRLRPRSFYDLVIEVAIVRPGPIQGDMVHPYLRRRNGEERVEYPSEALRGRAREDPGRAALPGAGDADRDRRRGLHRQRIRSVAPRHGDLQAGRHDPHLPHQVHRRHGRQRLRARVRRTLLPADRGFWDLRLSREPRRELRAPGLRLGLAEVPPSGGVRLRAAQQPADGLLRAGPDRARRSRPRRRRAAGRRQRQRLGLHARGGSGGSATGRGPQGTPFRAAAGLSPGQGAEGGGDGAAGPAPGRGLPRSARAAPPFRRQRRRARPSGARRCLRLARAEPARRALAGTRPRAHRPRARPAAPVRLGRRSHDGSAPVETPVALPPMTEGHEVAEDYANLRLSLRAHPLALLRPFLPRRTLRAEQLAGIEDGRWVEVAGLTLVRQRPGTASGVIFITLEDETGVSNLVVWPKVFERFRRVVLGAQLLAVQGKLQKEGLVIHVVAERLLDRTDLLRRLAETTFRSPLAHADHAKSGNPPDPRDPFWRPRDLDHFRSHPHIYKGILEPPEARAAARPGPLDPRAAGFKSRDFH